MKKVGNGRAPNKSRGAKEKNRMRPFRPDIKEEEPWNVSEARRNVVEEQTAKAYKRSSIGIGQAPRQGPKTPMASPQHPTTMENLPEELLSNIFIRLLAKQLAQMRSVNKSWNALLSQSSFIKSHLTRSIHNNDQFLLVFYDEAPSWGSDPFTLHSHPCGSSSHLELPNLIKLPFNPDPINNHTKVVGSVNGLICSFHCNVSGIHIWNPSLSAILTLPPYSMLPRGDNPVMTYLRFGYDLKTDDYKVIKFTGVIRPPILAVIRWLDVEIYSMRKGSWKLITERIPSHINNIDDDNTDVVCLDGHDGHLHWLACTNEKFDPDRILAFDLGSETFREIPLPHSILDPYQYRQNALGFLTGKLCVTSWVRDVGCEVWVMDEYGVAESWVKRHVFSQLIGEETWPLGFTSHNEFVIQGNGLVLYDPVANKTEVIRNYRHAEGVDKIVEYVDSLVWVAPDGG